MATLAAGRESCGRFHGTAAHYPAGRPSYAVMLIRRVAPLTGLTRQHAGRVLSCGPDVPARAFAPPVGAVARDIRAPIRDIGSDRRLTEVIASQAS